jgi:hypothetical protein
MNKPLRKRHMQVWSLLLFLIPAGITSAYLVIPGATNGKLLQEDNTAALPIVIKKTVKENYSAYLRSSADKKNYQLQWISSKASTQPSALVYKESKGEREPIGRVGSAGSYLFPLKADSTNSYDFILYDIIHRQVIDSIKFRL